MESNGSVKRAFEDESLAEILERCIGLHLSSQGIKIQFLCDLILQYGFYPALSSLRNFLNCFQ